MSQFYEKEAFSFVRSVIEDGVFTGSKDKPPAPPSFIFVDEIPLQPGDQIVADHGEDAGATYMDIRDAAIEASLIKLTEVTLADYDHILGAPFRSEEPSGVYKSLASQEPPLGESLVNWVVEDLFLITQSLLAFGETYGLIDDLRTSYRLDLMPVGWRGDRKTGALLVVDPRSILAVAKA